MTAALSAIPLPARRLHPTVADDALYGGLDLSATPRSIGYVTSSYPGAGLDAPVALALIERGANRHGEVITLQHLGKRRQARITPPCAFDPKGDRLNA